MFFFFASHGWGTFARAHMQIAVPFRDRSFDDYGVLLVIIPIHKRRYTMTLVVTLHSGANRGLARINGKSQNLNSVSFQGRIQRGGGASGAEAPSRLKNGTLRRRRQRREPF